MTAEAARMLWVEAEDLVNLLLGTERNRSGRASAFGRSL